MSLSLTPPHFTFKNKFCFKYIYIYIYTYISNNFNFEMNIYPGLRNRREQIPPRRSLSPPSNIIFSLKSEILIFLFMLILKWTHLVHPQSQTSGTKAAAKKVSLALSPLSLQNQIYWNYFYSCVFKKYTKMNNAGPYHIRLILLLEPTWPSEATSDWHSQGKESERQIRPYKGISPLPTPIPNII